VDLKPRGGLSIDRPQELEKLGVAMAGQALADHRPAQHVERGEQGGGAVALVVVGHRARAALLHRERRLRAIQRLDLALLVHAQNDRVLGRVQV